MTCIDSPNIGAVSQSKVRDKSCNGPRAKQLSPLLIRSVLCACTAACVVTAVAGAPSVLAMQSQGSPVEGTARMTHLACGGGGSGSYRKPAKPGSEQEGHS
jgi:hypothetical protein